MEHHVSFFFCENHLTKDVCISSVYCGFPTPVFNCPSLPYRSLNELSHVFEEMKASDIKLYTDPIELPGVHHGSCKQCAWNVQMGMGSDRPCGASSRIRISWHVLGN